MPIQVTCPGCHTRFRVGDQHAGKEGACPKCKGTIQIPKASEKVVVHAPVHSELGAIDSTGQHVLKPVARKDSKVRPLMVVGIVLFVGAAFATAWALRVEKTPEANIVVLAVAAAILGPPVAWAGYSFLRDPELEAYHGKSLWIRSLACGLVYALLWAAFSFVKVKVWGDVAAGESLELYQIAILAVPFVGVGAFTAFVSFDLEPGNGAFHYALYLLVTILLRMTYGLPVV